jgi:hypothetical protein
MREAGKFDEAAHGYPGVVVRGRRVRLIVSPRGAVYRVQRRDRGAWRSVGSFASGAFARAWAAVVADDLPDHFRRRVAAVPDDPGDCPAVPAPDRRRFDRLRSTVI